MKIHNAISNKKILIYGLGKSGISSFNFLKKKNSCCIFDDNRKVIKKNYNKYYISKLKLLKIKFDYIIISPGININNCTLSTYLKKNSKLIITELDIFYKFFPKIFTITITGTNGKSTTCKLLYEILLKHGIDARLTGNIGNPLLKEKKISRKTIFIVEASSYQLAYSKFFKSNISLILNISIDHLERHLTLRSYI
ncbi:Mur ligase family protein, partial [Candidatus Pelagibacter sp.]|nr:Mur ligase family protein [Candidatus Pelagibacter sp.]